MRFKQFIEENFDIFILLFTVILTCVLKYSNDKWVINNIDSFYLGIILSFASAMTVSRYRQKKLIDKLHQTYNLNNDSKSDLKKIMDKLNHSYDCEDLETREVMYMKVSHLITQAKKLVLDTTWGFDAPEPTKAEGKALDKYLNARREAVNRKLAYKEIITESLRRKRRIEKSAKENQGKSYYPRKLDKKNKPVFDFMVVDSEHIILSLVSSKGTQVDKRFMYIRSKPLAKFFGQWFNECWMESKDL